MTTETGYDYALREICAGRANGRALWCIITDEHQRDRFALKPSPWEGRGEYQCVSFDDGRDVFVKIGDRSLPIRKEARK